MTTAYQSSYNRARQIGRKSVIPVLEKMKISIESGRNITVDDVEQTIKWLKNPSKKYEPNFEISSGGEKHEP